MGLLVSSEHCIASPKLAPVASLVSAPALALSFIHTISTTYRFGPCGVVGDAPASSKRCRCSPLSRPWALAKKSGGAPRCRSPQTVSRQHQALSRTSVLADCKARNRCHQWPCAIIAALQL